VKKLPVFYITYVTIPKNEEKNLFILYSPKKSVFKVKKILLPVLIFCQKKGPRFQKMQIT
jgi:hypothetical protein